MSLDVHLEEILPGSFDGEYTCERCGHENKLQAFTDLYSANITHNLNRMADEAGVPLWALPYDAIRSIDERIKPAVFDVLSPDASVKSRTSFGGTAPAQVRKRIEAAKKALGMSS